MAALTKASSAPNLVGLQVLPEALGGVPVGAREGRVLRSVGLVMSWVSSCTGLCVSQTVPQAGACLFPGLFQASIAASVLRAFP